MWEAFRLFLETYTEELGAAVVLATGGGWLISRFKKKTELSDKTNEKIAPVKAKDSAATNSPCPNFKHWPPGAVQSLQSEAIGY